MGSSGGFIDFDGDNRIDIVIVGGSTLPVEHEDTSSALRIYKNNGAGQFSDVTQESGLENYHSYGMGLTVADYDNDGDSDIFLANLGKNFLFRNDGGYFEEIGALAGIAEQEVWSSSAIFFDADRDGFLDLYVANYVAWSPETDVVCEHLGKRDYCNPLHYSGIADDFYRNNGDGTFTNVTTPAGFLGDSEMGAGKGLGVIELDFNDDGWSDVYVTNDGGRNFLFENNGDGTFRERALRSGVAYDRHGAPRAGMGVDAGVVDSTGELTLIVGNFSQETLSVWRHQRNGFFEDRAGVSGLGFPTRQTLTFGLVLFDVDLDSDLDLMLANGNVIEQIASMQDGVTFRQRPQLFLNRGDGVFDEQIETAGPLTNVYLGRGLAVGDIDLDGDQDVLMTENNGPIHLWRNDNDQNAYLRIRLQGNDSNRDAVGARVVVTLGDLVLERMVRAGSSYGSHSEKTLTFGLGQSQTISSVLVSWPSGLKEQFENVLPNQDNLLIEGTGSPATE